jgi:hypothetical protein
MAQGSFRERVRSAWVEMRESPGRSTLQALGVMLGVASVLGGFSIADSQRRQADRLFIRIGGLDKLNVQPAAAVKDGTTPSALQTANLGLRSADADSGADLQRTAIDGVSQQKTARVRVRSPYADQERQITGGGVSLSTKAASGGGVFSTTISNQPLSDPGTEASVFFPTERSSGPDPAATRR